MESGFVYLWFDRKHKRYYLGKHWGPENDGYVCSSTWMKRAYNRRPDDFRRKILERVSSSRIDLCDAEYRWGELISPSELGSKYYNLKRPGDRHWHDDPLAHKTVSEKISLKTKEAMSRPEVRKAYEDGMKTKKPRPKMTREERLQRKRDKYTKKDPEIVREIHRQNTTEMWKTRNKTEHGKAISEAKKAKGTSPESRERYRQAALKREAAKRSG